MAKAYTIKIPKEAFHGNAIEEPFVLNIKNILIIGRTLFHYKDPKKVLKVLHGTINSNKELRVYDK